MAAKPDANEGKRRGKGLIPTQTTQANLDHAKHSSVSKGLLRDSVFPSTYLK